MKPTINNHRAGSGEATELPGTRIKLRVHQRRFLICGALLAVLAAAGNAMAQSASAAGRITESVAVPEGLLLKFDNAAALSNCSQVSLGWLLVPERNKSMVAAATMVGLLRADKLLTVTVSGAAAAGQYCTVTRLSLPL